MAGLTTRRGFLWKAAASGALAVEWIHAAD
jgi:hypothetical protein